MKGFVTRQNGKPYYSLFVIEGQRPEIANNSLIDEGEARAINVKVCQFAELQN